MNELDVTCNYFKVRRISQESSDEFKQKAIVKEISEKIANNFFTKTLCPSMLLVIGVQMYVLRKCWQKRIITGKQR